MSAQIGIRTNLAKVDRAALIDEATAMTITRSEAEEASARRVALPAGRLREKDRLLRTIAEVLVMTEGDPGTGFGERAAAGGVASTKPGTRMPLGEALISNAGRLLQKISNNKVNTLLIYLTLVFVKVLAVSAWRPSTALGVLSVSSLPVIVTGATLSALSPVALIGLAGIVYVVCTGRWKGRWMRPGTQSTQDETLRVRLSSNRTFALMVGLLGLIVVMLTPWSVACGVLVVAAFLGLLVRTATGLSRSNPPRQPVGNPAPHAVHQRSFMGCGALLAALLVYLTYSQLVAAVWVPHERLVEANGKVRAVGYVLSDNNGNITLLQSHSRLLIILPDTLIATRQVCDDREISFGNSIKSESDSLLLVLLGRQAPPPCTPSASSTARPTSLPAPSPSFAGRSALVHRPAGADLSQTLRESLDQLTALTALTPAARQP